MKDRIKYELIKTLARKCLGQMGRTALMKYLYFLQTVRNVPLAYRFTLYSYGPFDSDVLSDLGEAELLGYVKSEIVGYPGGYGYEISPTEPPSESEFVDQIEKDIDWIMEEFGQMNSAQLELASTIVFADRERSPLSQNLEELVDQVRKVKPHFNVERIQAQVESLFDKGILLSVRR